MIIPFEKHPYSGGAYAGPIEPMDTFNFHRTVAIAFWQDQDVQAISLVIELAHTL